VIIQHGRAVSDVSREFDLGESAVRRWVRQAQVDQGNATEGVLTTIEREELARLRRDVKRLQMER